MLNIFARFLLTCSAIAPVIPVYAVVEFLRGEYSHVAIMLTVCIVLIFICLRLLRYAQRHLEQIGFSMRTVEAADRENTALLLLYLTPLITGRYVNLDWIVLAAVVLLFLIVMATGHQYHFNPLLNIFGWHFYKVMSKEGVTYVMVTKKKLHTAMEIANVGQLTEYLIIDLDRS